MAAESAESLASLLRRVAVAESLDEQRELMLKIEKIKSQRYAAYDADRALDLSIKEAVEIVPRGLHELHTASTDWLLDTGLQVQASASDAQNTLVAEAILWFGRVPDFVKADQEEFRVQAANKGKFVASQFGDQAEAAAQSFVSEADRLYRQAVKAGTVKSAAMIHNLGPEGGHVEVPEDEWGYPKGLGSMDHVTSPSSDSADTSSDPSAGHSDHGLHPYRPEHYQAPGLRSEVDKHLSGDDTAGVGEMSEGYASQQVHGASLQQTASLVADDELAAILAGFSVTALDGDVDADDGEADAADDVPNGTHDSHKTGASSLPQADVNQGSMNTNFPTFGGDPQEPNVSSNRAPVLQEIQDYTGWDGSSVVPTGGSPAEGENHGTLGEQDASNNNSLGFPVSGSRIAVDTSDWPKCRVCGEGISPVERAMDSNNIHSKCIKKEQADKKKESSMPEAQCPTCSGTGHVSVRKQAYSGLPQIDQIVNADESPGQTPLPQDVAFPLTGWGEPGQGEQNVNNAIQQTEQMIGERNKKSPLLSTGQRRQAGGRDNSGWLGDMGAKGPDYPGYSEPTGYDGSNNLGEPDPVYGYGGDNGNQPLEPYGEDEANDFTNNPGMNWQPGQDTHADQAYRTVAPSMSTSGSRSADPFIQAAQDEIKAAQATIRTRLAMLNQRAG